jgi:hypothetical protein
MTETTKTPFNIRCEILEDLWMNYRNDENFADFFDYNDLSLPFAYAIVNNLIEPNDKIEPFINEAFELLLSGLEIEDTGNYENLDELLMSAGE